MPLFVYLRSKVRRTPHDLYLSVFLTTRDIKVESKREGTLCDVYLKVGSHLITNNPGRTVKFRK